MVNKKRPMELSIGTMVVIVLAISILILGLALVKSIFDKPEFIFTEEECFENLDRN